LTQEDAEDFLKNYAFVGFPGLAEWLRGTDNADRSFEMWAKALVKCERKECEAVIDAWISGDVEAPKYLRDGFVLHIRSCVMARRSQQRIYAEKVANAAQAEMPKQRSIMGQIQGSKIWIDNWEPMKEAVLAGELDQQSALHQWYAILGIKPNQVRK
jgi:hypothetical protein